MNYQHFRFPSYCLVLLLSTSFNTVFAAPFAKGDIGISVLIGSGRAFYDNYTIVGAGVGYYVADGLRLGINAETWLGGDVSINKVSPQLQYVFSREKKLKPYIGTFYRRTTIEGFDDLNSAGARAGVYLSGRD
ncbi:MAG: hypothetical protein OEM07_05880, partial [Gammaproteobacteria bacterium]|nr:hypothetical protein [Gammaproteobacteria bacterium]